MAARGPASRRYLVDDQTHTLEFHDAVFVNVVDCHNLPLQLCSGNRELMPLKAASTTELFYLIRANMAMRDTRP
jgi:hypothetical protein